MAVWPSHAEIAVLTDAMIDCEWTSTTCTVLLPSETQRIPSWVGTILFGPWPLVVAVPPPYVVTVPTNPGTWPANAYVLVSMMSTALLVWSLT